MSTGLDGDRLAAAMVPGEKVDSSHELEHDIPCILESV